MWFCVAIPYSTSILCPFRTTPLANSFCLPRQFYAICLATFLFCLYSLFWRTNPLANSYIGKCIRFSGWFHLRLAGIMGLGLLLDFFTSILQVQRRIHLGRMSGGGIGSTAMEQRRKRGTREFFFGKKKVWREWVLPNNGAEAANRIRHSPRSCGFVCRGSRSTLFRLLGWSSQRVWSYVRGTTVERTLAPYSHTSFKIKTLHINVYVQIWSLMIVCLPDICYERTLYYIRFSQKECENLCIWCASFI